MSSNKVFLDIAIGNREAHAAQQASYDRASEWIKIHGSTYGFSLLEALSDEERDTGPILLTPPNPLRGGRLIIDLHQTDCPKTCNNFRALCVGGKVGRSSKKPLHYLHTRLHRVVPGFVAQGGDVTRGDGSGGDSIYPGGKFNDEKPGLAPRFDGRGVVAMANSGKNSNTSQFFVTLTDDVGKLEKLNGKYVVFGRVVEGLEVLDEIDKVEVKGETPLVDVVVVGCGEVKRPKINRIIFFNRFPNPELVHAKYPNTAPTREPTPPTAIPHLSFKPINQTPQPRGSQSMKQTTTLSISITLFQFNPSRQLPPIPPYPKHLLQ
ncbi:cyclophilin-like domain-containing protein [Jimgerdemannia flammicorona]|uniref:peptidylprolyl isomerase n=1 Tax=Jimgerdemannia flammicorona TaxID=994334 RepID=A0A433QYS3_9FUNG|nr:cyclophilin-like domain-containing protein [Jimgerdemannia flammicorona]